MSTAERHAGRRRRRTLHVAGLEHPAPIPLGCRIDGVLFSSAVMGIDPATGRVPDDPRDQVTFAFSNVRELLAAGDAMTDDVVFMSVLLEDNELRAAVNEEWVDMFPDPSDRPARHTTIGPLPGDLCIQLEVVAIVGDGS